jgi:hypothetical protein
MNVHELSTGKSIQKQPHINQFAVKIKETQNRWKSPGTAFETPLAPTG